jgi:hypothetical protein
MAVLSTMSKTFHVTPESGEFQNLGLAFINSEDATYPLRAISLIW